MIPTRTKGWRPSPELLAWLRGTASYQNATHGVQGNCLKDPGNCQPDPAQSPDPGPRVPPLRLGVR